MALCNVVELYNLWLLLTSNVSVSIELRCLIDLCFLFKKGRFSWLVTVCRAGIWEALAINERVLSRAVCT